MLLQTCLQNAQRAPPWGRQEPGDHVQGRGAQGEEKIWECSMLHGGSAFPRGACMPEQGCSKSCRACIGMGYPSNHDSKVTVAPSHLNIEGDMIPKPQLLVSGSMERDPPAARYHDAAVTPAVQPQQSTGSSGSTCSSAMCPHTGKGSWIHLRRGLSAPLEIHILL